jgi:hypothetical protein
MNKVAIPLSIILALLMVTPSFSKVYMTRDKALKTAFPDADRIDKETVFISEGQVKK